MSRIDPTRWMRHFGESRREVRMRRAGMTPAATTPPACGCRCDRGGSGMPRRARSLATAGMLAAIALAMTAPACRQDMYNQAKATPLTESVFFGDGRSARGPVPGTVARGQLAEDRVLATGIGPDGRFVGRIPVSVDRALLLRGRERYDIFCAPCHDRTGSGDEPDPRPGPVGHRRLRPGAPARTPRAALGAELPGPGRDRVGGQALGHYAAAVRARRARSGDGPLSGGDVHGTMRAARPQTANAMAPGREPGR